MPLKTRVGTIISLSCLLASPAFAGYTYPLQSPEIHNAYFLGERNNEQTAAFFDKYAHMFREPQPGEYTITEIDVLTPYAQIVQRGAKDMPGDSPLQTETDVRKHPLPFLVRVQVIFNPAYHGVASLVGSQGDGQDFSVDVQQAQKIAPQKIAKHPFWSEHGPSGVNIEVEIDPSKISSAPMHIIVKTPEGKSVSADFDLSQLK